MTKIFGDIGNFCIYVWKRVHWKELSLCHNSDFLITISLEPNVVDLRYFKPWILLNQIIRVWNIKGLQHRVLKILRFKYLILLQRFNSFNPGFVMDTLAHLNLEGKQSYPWIDKSRWWEFHGWESRWLEVCCQSPGWIWFLLPHFSWQRRSIFPWVHPAWKKCRGYFQEFKSLNL